MRSVEFQQCCLGNDDVAAAAATVTVATANTAADVLAVLDLVMVMVKVMKMIIFIVLKVTTKLIVVVPTVAISTIGHPTRTVSRLCNSIQLSLKQQQQYQKRCFQLAS